MAEFVDVLKMARRMCKNVDACDDCPIYDSLRRYCKLSRPLFFSDSDFAKCEAAIMEWGAENPEVRYPTWKEWQQEHFRDGANIIRPCEFMSIADAHCFDYMYTYGCRDCANQPIPADVARKLGIKPVTKENSG